MKKTLAVAFLCGIALGVGAALLCVALYTGWYEYYWASNLVEARETMNYQKWEPCPGLQNNLVLRRPRYRIGW